MEDPTRTTKPLLDQHPQLATMLDSPHKVTVCQQLLDVLHDEPRALAMALTLLCDNLTPLLLEHAKFEWDSTVIDELLACPAFPRLCNLLQSTPTVVQDRLSKIQACASQLAVLLQSYNSLFPNPPTQRGTTVPGLDEAQRMNVTTTQDDNTSNYMWKLAVISHPQTAWELTRALKGMEGNDPKNKNAQSALELLQVLHPDMTLYSVSTLAQMRPALGSDTADQILQTLPQSVAKLPSPPFDYFDLLAVQPSHHLPPLLVAHNTSQKKRKRDSPTPALYTEHMEFNEFAVSLGFMETVQPSPKLLSLVHHWHTIRATLNNCILKLMQLQKNIRKPQVIIDTESFAVKIVGELTPDKQLSKIIVGLYYHSLERILSDVPTAKLHNLLHSQSFVNGLLACVCHVVTYSMGITQKLKPSGALCNLPIYSLLEVCDCTGYEFLKISETFVKALGSGPTRPSGSSVMLRLPKLLVREMEETDIHILDSLVWAQSEYANAMVTVIGDLQDAKHWPVPGLAPTLSEEKSDNGPAVVASVGAPNPKSKLASPYKCVDYILRKVQRLAYRRLEGLCLALRISNLLYPTWLTFRYMLRHYIHFLYDRHVDHFVLCCIYGVSRKTRPDLKFTTIIDAYVSVRSPELGETTCHRIVRNVKISNHQVDTVIKLYNSVFVPIMKNQLLKMHEWTATGMVPMGGVAAVQSTVLSTAPLELGMASAKATEQANEVASSGVSTFP